MNKAIPLNRSIQTLCDAVMAANAVDPTLVWVLSRIPTYFLKCRQGDQWRTAYPVTTAYLYRMFGEEIVEGKYLAKEIDRMDRLALEAEFKLAMVEAQRLMDVSGFSNWWAKEDGKPRIERASFYHTEEAFSHRDDLIALVELLKGIYARVSTLAFHPDHVQYV